MTRTAVDLLQGDVKTGTSQSYHDYWTVGFSAMAAGGAAWYLHWGLRPDPGPVRDDQVFTDEAD